MYKWIKRNNMRDFYCYTVNFSVLFLKHYAADRSSKSAAYALYKRTFKDIFIRIAPNVTLYITLCVYNM